MGNEVMEQNGTQFSQEKEENPAICIHIDESCFGEKNFFFNPADQGQEGRKELKNSRSERQIGLHIFHLTAVLCHDNYYCHL